jgi:hypothetical protein
VAHVAKEVSKLSVKDPCPNKEAPEEDTGSPMVSVASAQPPMPNVAAEEEEITATNNAPAKTWKRMARNNNNKDLNKDTLTTQHMLLGAPRDRQEENDATVLPPAKRIIMLIPSLEESLGKEVLKQLRNEDDAVTLTGAKDAENAATDANLGNGSESLDILVESKEGNNVMGRMGVDVLEGQSSLRESDEGAGEGNLNIEGVAGLPNAGSKSGTDEGAWQNQ